MIRLRAAHITNFRLLRDVTLEFSTDFNKPMTLIRAENDSGKTTLLTALTWGLFGDQTLPDRRSNFRMHPIDWDPSVDGEAVEISVQIDFEIVDQDEVSTSFSLQRTTREAVEVDSFRAEPATLNLAQISKSGFTPVKNPTALLESLIPISLKDIFFTDGDRALVWIEATDEKSTKRRRVAAAVRALLGLELLEDAQNHVQQAKREAVRQSEKQGKGSRVASLSADLEAIEEELVELERVLKDLEADRDATTIRHGKADNRLRELLASGGADRKKLLNDFSRQETQLQAEGSTLAALIKAHRQLLNASSLGCILATGVLQKAAVQLAQMEDRKEIPNRRTSVIKDLLNEGTCVCGADLSAHTEAFHRLSEVLQDNEVADEARDVLSLLNSAVQSFIRDEDGAQWAEKLADSVQLISDSRRRIREGEAQLAETQARIAAIPDSDIDGLQGLVRKESEDLQETIREIGGQETRIRGCRQRRTETEELRKQAARQESKYLQYLAEEKATVDISSVIALTVSKLQGAKLHEVSEAMNEIFLNMIVADPEKGSIIQKAELTPDYDILVTGTMGRYLDPDRDLNGASRRALTLAFILALTKVSGVMAPNVIDTPLGMMSGQVRYATLAYAAAHSSQLIQFLTRSEIAGTEDLLDEYVGKVFTLSNSAHFPMQLANEPKTAHLEALVCGCNHKTFCPVCERRAINQISMDAEEIKL